MRPHAVVIVTPRGQYGAGLGERRERSLVQALVPEPPVEALHERVLLRLSRLGVVPGDIRSFAPGPDCHARELGTIVGNARPRLAPDRDDGVEFAGNTST